jgi:cysteine sulfinate desulfinase/cysteine desulfurase-like protein
MGLTKEQAERTIRFSIGKYTTKEEIENVLQMIKTMAEV